MPKKISVKPILELRAAGISMRKIEALMHVSRHTISAIYKAADSHTISWDNVKDFDEDKIYEMLFPPISKTSIFEEVDYDYVHSELKKQESILSFFGTNIVINVFQKKPFLVVTQSFVKVILTMCNYQM